RASWPPSGSVTAIATGSKRPVTFREMRTLSSAEAGAAAASESVNNERQVRTAVARGIGSISKTGPRAGGLQDSVHSPALVVPVGVVGVVVKAAALLAPEGAGDDEPADPRDVPQLQQLRREP